MKLDGIYGDYFPEYANYFGRPLKLKKSIYGMINFGYLSSDELTNLLIYKAYFKQSQCQMSIYYKYAPYRSRLVMLSYVDGYLYWYTNEELGKFFVDTLGKIFHVDFLGYAH